MRYATEIANSVFEFAALVNSPHAAEMTSRVHGAPLSWMQVSAIWHVAWSPGIRQSDLRRRVGTSSPTMSKLCARLTEIGLFKAVTDELDRRVHRMYLTADGEALARTVFSVGDNLVEVALKDLPAKEIEMARGVIDALLINLTFNRESIPDIDLAGSLQSETLETQA